MEVLEGGWLTGSHHLGAEHELPRREAGREAEGVLPALQNSTCSEVSVLGGGGGDSLCPRTPVQITTPVGQGCVIPH